MKRIAWKILATLLVTIAWALPAVAQALATVTSQDAQGWFHQCGYAMH